MDWSFLTNMFGGSGTAGSGKDAATGTAPSYYSPGSGVVGPSQTAQPAASTAAPQPSAVSAAAPALASSPTAPAAATPGAAPTAGGAQSGGINYGALIAGGMKGIGHGIGKYAMAGAENTPIPQAPASFTPVLAKVDFVPPQYTQPVGA